MIRWSGIRLSSSLGLALLVGCTLAEVKVDVVSERTALENQVLGTYNALDTEMLLVASVRGVDSAGTIREPPRQSREHRDAVLAMQTLSFHEDDLQAFKRLGWVGENVDGLLTKFPLVREDAPEDLAEFVERYSEEELATVTAEVNRAREIVMGRVIDLNEDLTNEDLPQVRRVFGKLNVENALPGEKIQLEDGTWAEQR
jgi:uncharacterized protein YdbL (DUF1318 family)